MHVTAHSGQHAHASIYHGWVPWEQLPSYKMHERQHGLGINQPDTQ